MHFGTCVAFCCSCVANCTAMPAKLFPARLTETFKGYICRKRNCECNTITHTELPVKICCDVKFTAWGRQKLELKATVFS